MPHSCSPCGPQGEDRSSGKTGSAQPHPRGENGKAGHGPDPRGLVLPTHSVSLHKAPEKRKQKKINLDEAEGKDRTTSVSRTHTHTLFLVLLTLLFGPLQRQNQML